MIVSCPNCTTRYMLDAGTIRPPGRHVRCAKCQTTWYQEPALDLPREVMLEDEDDGRVTDKSRMLPPPSGMRTVQGVPPIRETLREAPRESHRDVHRDPLADTRREPAREIARDRGHDDPGRFRGREISRDTHDDHENDPISNIERGIRGDLGREAERGPNIVREIGRDQMRDLTRDIERREAEREISRDPFARDRGREGARDNVREPDRERTKDRGFEREPERRREPPVRTPGNGGGGRWAAIILILMLLGGLGWVADQYPEEIVRAFPQASPLFELIGKKVNARGLDFEGITQTQETDATGRVLVIRGQIVNITDRDVAVPDVELIVRDADQRELLQWTFTPDARTLRARSRTAFATRIEAPPPDAWDVKLRFAKGG